MLVRQQATMAQLMSAATEIEIDLYASLFWVKGETIKKMSVSGTLENN